MINMAMWRGMNCSYALIRKSAVFWKCPGTGQAGMNLPPVRIWGRRNFWKDGQLKCIFREENGDIAAVGVNWTQKGNSLQQAINEGKT